MSAFQRFTQTDARTYAHISGDRRAVVFFVDNRWQWVVWEHGVPVAGSRGVEDDPLTALTACDAAFKFCSAALEAQ